MSGLALLGGPLSLALPFLFRAERGILCPACGGGRDTTAKPCPSCDAVLEGYRASDTDIIVSAEAAPAE